MFLRNVIPRLTQMSWIKGPSNSVVVLVIVVVVYADAGIASAKWADKQHQPAFIMKINLREVIALIGEEPEPNICKIRGSFHE